MKIRTAFVAVAAVVLGLAVPVSQVEAQQGWFFDLEGGYVLPLGDMADALKGGPTFGAAAGQQVENVGVGLSFDVDLLSGADIDGTKAAGANFYRYHIFGEYSFTDPRVTKSRISLVIGAGGTSMNTDEVESLGRSVSSTFFSMDIGLHLGTGKVFAEVLWGGLFAGSDKTSEVWQQGFGTVSTIMFKGGLRL